MTLSQADLISGDFSSVRRAITRYREVLPAGAPFPTTIAYYAYADRATKVMVVTITRDAAQNPTSILYAVYNPDGQTVQSSMTETVTYVNGFESTRTRVVNQ